MCVRSNTDHVGWNCVVHNTGLGSREIRIIFSKFYFRRWVRAMVHLLWVKQILYLCSLKICIKLDPVLVMIRFIEILLVTDREIRVFRGHSVIQDIQHGKTLSYLQLEPLTTRASRKVYRKVSRNGSALVSWKTSVYRHRMHRMMSIENQLTVAAWIC